MLQEYVKNEPDGGKVLLVTGWGTKQVYAELPSQVVQIPSLFRPRPLDPSHDYGNMPWEKPRGSYSDAFETPTLASRRLKDGEIQKQKHFEGLGIPRIRRWLKIWVLHKAVGLLAVYCAEENTFRQVLGEVFDRIALSRGLILPAIPYCGHSWHFTVDHGATTLEDYMDTSLEEYGVRWGTTVELFWTCR